MEISFNGNATPSFLIVQNVKFPLLPNITQNTKKASGRSGLLDFGNEIGAREIQVGVTIKANSSKQYREFALQLAEWLYYDEPKKFVHGNDPTRYVMAKVTGDVNLQEIVTFGQGTISFVCYDPYIYSNFATEEVFKPTAILPHIAENNGNISSYPEFNIKFKQDTTQFSILTRDKQLSFGKSANIDTDTVIDTDPLILHDDLSSTVNWTLSSTAEGGIVTNSFVSNGYSFQVADYGQGTKWHGGSMHRALPKALQDFSITANVGFRTYYDVENVGKIDIYLKDANNVTMAKMTIYDTSSTIDLPTVAARLGPIEGDYSIVNSHGDYKGALRFWDNGILRIKRIDNVWRVYFAKFDTKGNHIQTVFKEYINTNNMWMNKIARIQFAIMTYGEQPAVNEMNITDLKVWEHNKIQNDTQIPLKFKTGDNLYINNETGEILLNGEPFYSSLDPASSFINLQKGLNQIQAYPNECIDEINSKIKYRDRWL